MVCTTLWLKSTNWNLYERQGIRIILTGTLAMLTLFRVASAMAITYDQELWQPYHQLWLH